MNPACILIVEDEAAVRHLIQRILESANLLERAAALMPQDDPERNRLMADAGAALNRQGDSRRAEAVLDSAIHVARRSGDVVTEASCRFV